MKRKGILKAALVFTAFTASVVVLVFMTNIFVVKECTVLPKDMPFDNSTISESILGKNIFLINTEKVQKEIESDPSIKSAAIKRRLPDSATVEIVKREKKIEVEYMNGTIGISSDGYVMGFDAFMSDEKQGECLLVKGLEFKRFEINSILVAEDYELLENIITLAEFLESEIEESTDFVSVEGNKLILQIHQDFIVDFGNPEDPIENKLGKMKLILQDLSSKNINRGIINMRYGKSPVYYPIQ